MKKLFMILSLVLVFCFTFSCQKGKEVADEPDVDIAAETEAVREAHLAMSKSGPEKNVDILLSHCADDVIRAAGTPQNKEAIREFYTNWTSNGNYWDNTTIDKIVISASGDMALVIYSYDRFWVDEGETQSVKGCDDMTWEKQGDGSWKIIAW